MPYGVAVLWQSDDRMSWLIDRVDEERALDAENVIPIEGGGVLLTNPGDHDPPEATVLDHGTRHDRRRL